jgi:hypothetical protein
MFFFFLFSSGCKVRSVQYLWNPIDYLEDPEYYEGMQLEAHLTITFISFPQQTKSSVEVVPPSGLPTNGEAQTIME